MDYKPHILTKVIQYIFLSKRHRMGLTQLALSIKSQITRQFISQVESGKRSPSIFTMSTLASVGNTTLSEMFKEIDELYRTYEQLEAQPSLTLVNRAASQNKGNTYVEKTSHSKKRGSR